MITLNSEKLNILRLSPLFAGNDDDAVAAVLDAFDARTETYRKGEILHAAETPLPRFGMVLKGVVEACIDDINGNRVIMTDVSPGVTFGESLCYLRVTDSPVYIYAAEDCEIIWLAPAVLYSDECEPFVNGIKTRFTSMLAKRTLSMNNRIQVLSKLRLREKLVTYFSELASEAGSRIFTIPMSREDMATYIGANRTAVSREMAAMKKEGLIDYHMNTVRILD